MISLENFADLNKLVDMSNATLSLTDLLSTMFYGNTNFSVSGIVLDNERDHKVIIKKLGDKLGEDFCIEDLWAAVIENGGYLVVIDEDDEEKWKLDKAALDNGAKLVTNEKYDWILKDFLSDSLDLESADAFLQLCIMNDIVFG